METIKEKVEEFLSVLNATCFDPFLFPGKTRGEGDGFVLHHDNSVIGLVGVWFIEGDKKLPVIIKTWNFRGKDEAYIIHAMSDVWRILYQELTRYILLSEDCVGKLKSPFDDGYINILSFKTICKNGLKDIR
jgi:hypothetical protein